MGSGALECIWLINYYITHSAIVPPFQTLNPLTQGGHLHHGGLLGQGVHAAAAAAGERDTSASVAAEEAATATGVRASSCSTFPNQVAKEEGEK